MRRKEEDYTQIFIPNYNLVIVEETPQYILNNLNGVNLKFNSKDYYQFVYTINRQYELGTLPTINPNFKTTDSYVVVDSGFNIISEYPYENNIEEQIEYDIKNKISLSEKCFWGTITDKNELLVFVNDKISFIEKEFKEKADKEFKVKVLIQPDDKQYFESFFVYIRKNKDYSYPPYYLNTYFVFKEEGDYLKLIKKYIDEWVY